MSLDIAKLEKVRELAGGIVQARCPACAEGGHDRTGEHLRIYPDGRFGCCVHPKDGDHRKRIFALVGCKGHGPSTGTFTLRIKTPPALPWAKSVKAALTTHSLGTPQTELENAVRGVRVVPIENSRTPRTGISELRTRARVESTTDHIDMGENSHRELKDLESAVRDVRITPTGERLPFLTADGSLSIPFASPERYHWWEGGQAISLTREECGLRIADCGMEGWEHDVGI